MIIFPKPEPLFNPLTVPVDELLSGWEILAGPYGLIAFLPLIPLLRLLGRARRRSALVAGGLVWLVATAGPIATLILLAFCLAASAWVVWLVPQSQRPVPQSQRPVPQSQRAVPQSRSRAVVALVWIGLAALIFPAWWYPRWDWYGWGELSRMPLLHNIGLAYFLLRFIAWGVDLARHPDQRLRATDTLCWLLYPPCMRLGPVVLRRAFLERLDGWDPRAGPPWKDVGRRLGLFVLGLLGLGAVGLLLNWGEPALVAPDQPDFFAAPQGYTTGSLLRVFYLIPIQIYLLLWTYNELAAALSLWVGIRVDNNFDWLPRATSVRDFWRRWHVTVGRWLRDYVYVPLGGRRGPVVLHYAAVFGFCAVWHGASWSFVAWGALQTLALTVQRWWDEGRRRLGKVGRPAGGWWTGLCWLTTMHFQIASIVVFVDFEHRGGRLFHELWQRLWVAVTA